jgi:cytohesin
MNQSVQKVIVPIGVVGVAVGIIIIGLGFPGDGSKPEESGKQASAEGASGATLGIHEAAFEGNLQAVRAAVAKGESVRSEYLGQSPDLMGLTPLMAAAMGGHEDAARELIDAGAAVDAVNAKQRTALMFAAEAGSAPCVRVLTGGGAQVDAADQSGRTALFYAASLGGPEATQALLDAGADPNARDATNRTPIMEAIMGGNKETVLALLNAGADATAEDRGGTSVIEMAEAKTDARGRDVATIIRMAIRP